MRHRIFGFGSLLFAFALYVFGASSTLDGGDSGEFIAASHTLGISHAPGYPLIALLLKAFQVILPFGSVAYRCHVFSALTACALLAALFWLLEENRAAAWFAVISVAIGPLFLEQARVAEVFLLNALLVVGILLALRSDRAALAMLLLGLGWGNHQTVIVVAPALAWWAFRKKPSAAEIGLLFLALAVGLSVYIYLPIRAHALPPVNFGDPETWSRFWAVFTRKEFGTLSLHPAAVPFLDGTLLLEQVTVFFARHWAQLKPEGVFLCMMGTAIGFLRRETRMATALILVLWLGIGFGFELMANLSPFSDIGQWRLERFMLLPMLLLSGFAYIVYDSAMSIKATSVRRGLATMLILLLAPAAWAAIASPTFRWNMAFRDYAISTLRSAPTDTRLVIDRVLFDEPTSALLVATQVEGKRPDVKFYYRPGTLFEPVYGKDILALPWEARFERQASVERALIASSVTVRCLAFDKKNAPFPAPVLEGLLYAPGTATKVPSLIWSRSLNNQPLQDYPTRLIAVHTPYFLGKAALEAGNPELARQWFDSAMNIGPDMTWLQANIGGIYAQHNMLADAQRVFKTAAASDPYFYEGPFGLGYVALQEQRYSDAARALKQAVRVAPTRSDGWYMLGVACYEEKDAVCTRNAWENYLRLEPHGSMAEVVGKKLQEPLP